MAWNATRAYAASCHRGSWNGHPVRSLLNLFHIIYLFFNFLVFFVFFFWLPAAGGLFGKKERGNVGCLVREFVGGVFGKGICGLGGLFGFF